MQDSNRAQLQGWNTGDKKKPAGSMSWQQALH